MSNTNRSDCVPFFRVPNRSCTDSQRARDKKKTNDGKMNKKKVQLRGM